MLPPGKEVISRDVGIDILGGASSIIGIKVLFYIKNTDLNIKNT